jgi:predicted transcriptional regulator
MPATLVRLDPATYKQLKIRALVEKRSMASIIKEAIAEHLEREPLEGKRFKEYVAEGLAQNKDILDALERL